MDIDIYVNSRGISKDYCWLKVTKEKQEEAKPPIPQKVTDLIDSSYPSLVIASFTDETNKESKPQLKLLLLITALETDNRIDNRTRKIRNSIALVVQKSEEKILRTLAAQWLQEDSFAQLRSTINQAIKSEKDNGFSVNFEKLSQLINKHLKAVDNKIDPANNTTKNKVGNLKSLRGKLANELNKYNLQNINNDLLVVATQVNNKKDFQLAGVWRGLSSLIDSEDWEDLEDLKDMNMQERAKKFLGNVFEPRKFTSVIIFGLLIVSLACNGFLYLKWTEKGILQENIQNLKDKKSNLENDIQKLTRKQGKLSEDVKNLEDIKSFVEEEVESVNKIKQLLENELNRINQKLPVFNDFLLKYK